MDHEELYYRAMEEVVRLEGSPQQKVALLGELLWRSIRQYIGRRSVDVVLLLGLAAVERSIPDDRRCALSVSVLVAAAATAGVDYIGMA